MQLALTALTCIATVAYADNWGNFQRDNCRGEDFSSGAGKCQYSSILYGIPWGQSWEDHCSNAPATIQGQYFPHPNRCVNVGPGINEWGEFDVIDGSCRVDHNWMFEKIGRAIGKTLTCNFNSWSSDGCSVPAILADGVTKTGKNDLNAACVVHDYCYAVPSSYGTSKSLCDGLLYQTGNYRCGELPGDAACPLCTDAWFTYPAVSFFGDAWNNAQSKQFSCTLAAKQKWSALYQGSQLGINYGLYSPNGRFVLIMQSDGNLVLYRVSDNRALWASGTYGSGAVRAVMQSDGNLVVYTANNVPKWSSGTYGKPANFLLLQNDGNLVLYGMGSSSAQWSSGTYGYKMSATAHLRSVNSTVSSIEYTPLLGEMTLEKALEEAGGELQLPTAVTDMETLVAIMKKEHLAEATPADILQPAAPATDMEDLVARGDPLQPAQA